jgi:hypothetical protein
MTQETEELRRLLRDSASRFVCPESARGVRASRGFIDDVVVPVVAAFLKETRSAHAKLTAQVEHLKRRVELLDIRLRAPNESRALKFRIFNLEKEVALLRRAAKK